MTFANLSALGVVAGLAGLAALLFALQQLRTRYRDVTVVTTLFWRQVVDEAPVRKLRERFRHPLAYALILAICALLWLAFAEPRFEGAQDDTFHVLVLDGSAGMAARNRFDTVVDALVREVSQLPVGRRQVLWSGAEIRPLLGPDEHALLLTTRLARLAPEAAPASVERLLRQLSASPRPGQATSIRVFGDAPVRQEVLALVPPSISVTRATEPTSLLGNAGITGLGVSDAASGVWNRVDVFVNSRTTDDRDPVSLGDVRLDLDGLAIPAGAIMRLPPTGHEGLSFAIADVPAEGGLLTVSLASEDTLALDNAASVRLPRKPILQVMVSPSLSAVLGPVVDADPGVNLTAGPADVVIRRVGEPVGGDAPALEFVSSADQPQAFLLTHPDAFDSSLVFASAVDDIGLRQIDATSLAQESGRQIEVSVTASDQWRFSVWEDLLSENYNFTRSRTFPLFVANAVRWLAGTEAWHPFVAAGIPLSRVSAGDRVQVVGPSGRTLDPLGVDFVPPSAGELQLARGGQPLAVSLLDSDVTSGSRDASLQPAEFTPANLVPQTRFATWLVLLALLLLAAEWYLVQTGRMP
jgi:hypothetical protein